MTRASGFKGARARSKARPKQLRNNVGDAIEKTINEVHSAGRQNIQAMVKRRSGRLQRFYSKSLRRSQSRGFVGYVTARARKAAFYARFVHDGTAKMGPRPFHDMAVLEIEGRHRKRMRRALSQILDRRASPSGLARSGGGRERGLR